MRLVLLPVTLFYIEETPLNWEKKIAKETFQASKKP